MFTLINKRDMYSKPLETEEEPARHDWIDNRYYKDTLYENTFQIYFRELHCIRILFLLTTFFVLMNTFSW